MGDSIESLEKVVHLFHCFLLVFSYFGGVVGHAEVGILTNQATDLDTTPPEIQSIIVDKNPVYPGDSVTVNIDVKDQSEIGSVWFNISGSNGGGDSRNAFYNPNTGNYESTFTIDSSMKPEIYGAFIRKE